MRLLHSLLILASCATTQAASRRSSYQSELEEVRSWHEDFQTAVVQRLESSVARGRSHHRQTQQLLPIACLLVNEVLPGDLQCTCSFTTSLAFNCRGFERLCLSGISDGYCSTPTVSGELDLLSLAVNFEFCGFNATDGGSSVPGICITVGGTLVPPGVPLPTSKSTTKKAAVVVSKPLRNGKKSKDEDEESDEEDDEDTQSVEQPLTLSSKISSVLNTCTASDTNGKQCRNCRICDEGKGYTFDCSNIGRRMIQSLCTPMTVVSNLRLDQNITFLPRLDPPPATPAPVTAMPVTAAPTRAPTRVPTPVPTRAPVTKSPASAWGSLFSVWGKNVTQTIRNSGN